MQKYLELNIKIEPLQPWNEILMAELINIGFDSFTEENDGILAYVPEESFSEDELKNLWLLSHDEVKISYTIQECRKQSTYPRRISRKPKHTV